MSLHKLIFEIYDSSQFQTINYHSLDMLLMLGFIWIYRPRNLPPFFNVSLGADDDESNIQIYTCTIPPRNQILDESKPMNLQENILSIYSSNPELPLVVLHPMFGESQNKFVNELIENINVGTIEKEKDEKKKDEKSE